ncbi:MAG: dTMP kinase [Hydrogenophaga sp.]|jgi:dTMP kinase|uniref:dTMP kinase n=1 Tax=Hydrogenophaga sp. TaxID=1904254 RepID=UPI0027161336|nr:dTMP kinase [Hydrogenophaga sp.]MDO9031990.1 dTMP kinase [Hydrogenophaga sp.]
MHNAKFIVFEGLDGSGTSTQAALLEKRLNQEGHRCHLTSEPSAGPVGQMIRQAFKGRLRFSQAADRFDQQMAHLFSADRFDHLYNEWDGVIPMLARGMSVISTRYFFSSYAYHCTCEEDWALVERLNRDFPNPDLLVYLRNPVAESVRRLQIRATLDSYETPDKLSQVSANYERVLDGYPGRKVVIDATRPPQDIHESIVQHLKEI